MAHRPGGEVSLIRRPTITTTHPSISILNTAFELHKKADVLSDLFAHFEKRRADARGAERTYMLLALGYFHWWALEKDEAIAELNRAVEGAPNDHNLLLEVVALRELNNDFVGVP